jgi:hypothetical protein
MLDNETFKRIVRRRFASMPNFIDPSNFYILHDCITEYELATFKPGTSYVFFLRDKWQTDRAFREYAKHIARGCFEDRGAAHNAQLLASQISATQPRPQPPRQRSVVGFPLLNGRDKPDKSAGLWPSQPKKDFYARLAAWAKRRKAETQSAQIYVENWSDRLLEQTGEGKYSSDSRKTYAYSRVGADEFSRVIVRGVEWSEGK